MARGGGCVTVVGLSAVRAARAEEGIVVRGSGSATGRPTQVEMSATIGADAELAADAIVKFRDAKKRALAAMAALKNPDLTIVSGGVSIGGGGANDANAQMMAMRGIQVPAGGQKVRISETSRIVLAHTDKLEPDVLMEKLLKVLDVAKDAGFQVGPAPATNYYEMQMRAQEGEDTNRDGFLQAPRQYGFARGGLQGRHRRCQGQSPTARRTVGSQVGPDHLRA